MSSSTHPPRTSSLANQTPKPVASSGGLKNIYLTVYNAASCLAWAVVLYRVVNVLSANGKEAYNGGKGTYGWRALLGGKESAWDTTGEYVKWVQSAALLEVVHSLVGLVRSPVATTAMQVASRILLVWGICDQFPSVPANSLFYSTMLIAWSATEVVRYSYFVFALNGAVPGVLAWLRYNLFFVAYPLGISSEVALVYLSIPEAKARDPLLEWVGYGILAVYIPGAYILYTHMMTQRKRVMRGKAKAK